MARVLRPELSLRIPEDVLAELGWTADTPLCLEIRDQALVVKPVPAQPVEPDDRLVQRRLELGLTRSQLALVLGLTPAHIAAWEGEGVAPDEVLAELDRLAADPTHLQAILEDREPTF